MKSHPLPTPLKLTESFSLEGEDRIVLSILRKTMNEFPKDSKYFYLDIGCNDPISLSNTFLFYNLGFKGLCVDPLIESESKFKKKRDRDSFVKAAVSQDNGFKTLRVYSDDSSSSLDEATISRYDDKFKIRETREVETITLKKLLVTNKLMSVYQDIEKPLIEVISDMEIKGIKVDKEGLQKLSEEFESEIFEL